MKGIARKVTPYAVTSFAEDMATRDGVVSSSMAGLDLFLDVDALDDDKTDRAREQLHAALEALDRRPR